MRFSARVQARHVLAGLSMLLGTAACELQPTPILAAGEADAGELDADKWEAGEPDAGVSDASSGDGGDSCTDSSQCPAPMNECLVATCDLGVCGIVAIANDTPTQAGQLAGDCKRRVCDGTGNVAIVNDDNDPADDLNDCTADTCSGGQHVFTPVAGTCAQNGGNLCGDPAGPKAGQCVACNVDADCSMPGDVCDPAGGTNTCVPATCSDGAQNGNETGIDCGGNPCKNCLDTACQTSTDCQSGFCNANVCTACSSHLECVVTDYCDPATYGGSCVPDKSSGSTCNAVEECQSGNCTSGVCCNGACNPCTGTIGLPHPPLPRISARMGWEDVGDSALGDLNGDGVPDLVVVDKWFSNGSVRRGVRILINPGNGQFGEVGKIEIGLELGAIKMVDLDNSGTLDVAVLNTLKDLVTVLYNLGNGLFAPGIDYLTHPNPSDLIIANINGDALPDLVTTHFNDNTMGFLLNQGNQLFESATKAVVEKASVNAMADLNGDGLDDIVSATYGLNGKLNVLMNQGSTTFAPVGEYSTTGLPRNLKAADLNGDGLPDIVLGKENGVDVRLNQGNGTLATPTTYFDGSPVSVLTFADVNSDNRLDLITTACWTWNCVSVLMNVGNGALVPSGSYASVGGDGIHAADLNQNGTTDIVVVGGLPWEDDFEILLNLGNGTYAPNLDTYTTTANFYDTEILAADFNGDGKPDLATGVGVMLNQGNGIMGAETLYSGGVTFRSRLVADFNGDGKLDVVGYGDDLVWSIMYNQGSAILGPPTPAPSPVGPGVRSNPVAADFNGDYLPDLAIGLERETNTFPSGEKLWESVLYLFINQGNGTFAANEIVLKTSIDFSSPWTKLAAADFNGDGFVDIAYGTSTTGHVQILLNQGNANFTPGANYPIESECVLELVVGDVNGDGSPDIRACGVRLNQGDGTFGALIGSDRASASTLVDLSGDGVPDSVKLTTRLSVKRNVGDGHFAPTARYLTGGLIANGVTVADFNGDGKLDLAVMNYYGNSNSSGRVGILLNQCLP